MKPRNDGFNIVLVGRWNPWIFSPDWVKANLAVNSHQDIKIGLSIDNADQPRAIQFDSLTLYPGYHRLEIRPVSSTLQNMEEAQRVAEKILTLLPHTPVSATGINFDFVESEKADSVISLFQMADTSGIDAGKYFLQNIEIRRAYQLGQDFTLNLTLSWADGARARINFNYHRNTREAGGAASAFDVSACYEDSLRLAQNAYGLTIEEQTDDEHD